MLPLKAFRGAAVLLALGLLSACASSPSKQQVGGTTAVSQRSVNAAQSLLDRGDAAGALEQARIALQADPRNTHAMVLSGEVLETLGKPTEAAELFERAAKLAPANGPIQNAYGAWLCRNGRSNEGLQAFAKALEDDAYRSPGQALANAGTCALTSGQLDLAESNFRAALGIAPNDVQSLAGMASVEQQRGNALGARAFLQRREALGPLSGAELQLGIEIETAAGDVRAARKYQDQLTAQAELGAVQKPSESGSFRQ